MGSASNKRVTESASAESLVLCCYGVRLRVLDAAGLWLCDRLRRTLPREFVPFTASSHVAIDYVVTAVAAAGGTGHTEYLVTCDAVAVFAATVPDDVYVWLRRDIDRTVAQLRGPRPEARDVAANLLDVVDDALVSLPINGTRRSVTALWSS